MPPELREVFSSGTTAVDFCASPGVASGVASRRPGDERSALALRVWTTLLVLAAAKTSGECFLLKSEEVDGIDETIVCRGMAWIDFMAERFPLMRPQLGLLFTRAGAFQEVWEAHNVAQVAEACEAWNRQKDVRKASDVQRAMGVLTAAVTETHETFSTVLTAGGSGLSRWQRVVVLCTLIMGMLCVPHMQRELLRPCSRACPRCRCLRTCCPARLLTPPSPLPTPAALSTSGYTGKSPRYAATRPASRSWSATRAQPCHVGAPLAAWPWHPQHWPRDPAPRKSSCADC